MIFHNARLNYEQSALIVIKVDENFRDLFLKWWSCVISNKRGHVSALLGPHQHALVSM